MLVAGSLRPRRQEPYDEGEKLHGWGAYEAPDIVLHSREQAAWSSCTRRTGMVVERAI